jgi:hypothetical protein
MRLHQTKMLLYSTGKKSTEWSDKLYRKYLWTAHSVKYMFIYISHILHMYNVLYIYYIYYICMYKES